MLPQRPFDKIKVARKGQTHRSKTIGDIKAAASKSLNPVKVRPAARNPRAMRVRPAR